MITSNPHLFKRTLPIVAIVKKINNFHTSSVRSEIQKLTKLRVVDNSEIGKRAMAEGKPPKCIHVYNKTGVGLIGKTKEMWYLPLKLFLPQAIEFWLP